MLNGGSLRGGNMHRRRGAWTNSPTLCPSSSPRSPRVTAAPPPLPPPVTLCVVSAVAASSCCCCIDLLQLRHVFFPLAQPDAVTVCCFQARSPHCYRTRSHCCLAHSFGLQARVVCGVEAFFIVIFWGEGREAGWGWLGGSEEKEGEEPRGGGGEIEGWGR